MIFLLQAAEPRRLIGLPRSGEQTSSVENNKSGEWPPPLGSCTRYEVKRRNVFLLLWSHPMLCASPWTLTGSQSPSVPLTGSDCASRRGGAQREQTAGGGSGSERSCPNHSPAARTQPRRTPASRRKRPFPSDRRAPPPNPFHCIHPRSIEFSSLRLKITVILHGAPARP